MGAWNQTYLIKCKQKDIAKECDNLRDQARYDHGNSGYTGTIAEDSGGEDYIDGEMEIDEAEKYIEENARKWDDSMVIKIKGEKDTFLVGGCYSC